MKAKISITISSDVLRAIDRHGGRFKSRSAFLETAAQDFLARLARTKADRRDLEIINRNAERLNAEAEDVLAYQVKL